MKRGYAFCCKYYNTFVWGFDFLSHISHSRSQVYIVASIFGPANILITEI